ncbi:MAG: type II toxin-antitoxin system HicA family toxin [Gammaproteobacteria bacterium]|nr:type II toxin-antitoxin system HicA family toxin [Gammaproteobacteria bacterium]
MNNATRKVLIAIFRNPVPRNIEWRELEKLMLSVGAKEIGGSGSRVRFVFNNCIMLMHRPHPEKEIKPYQVRDARDFFQNAGVLP